MKNIVDLRRLVFFILYQKGKNKHMNTGFPLKRLMLCAAWFSPPAVYFLIHRHLHLPACAFSGTFGFPCPGCGIRRSLEAACSADFLSAVKAYPAVIPLALLYAAIGLGIGLKPGNTFMRERVLLPLFFLAVAAIIGHVLYTVIHIRFPL